MPAGDPGPGRSATVGTRVARRRKGLHGVQTYLIQPGRKLRQPVERRKRTPSLVQNLLLEVPAIIRIIHIQLNHLANDADVGLYLVGEKRFAPMWMRAALVLSFYRF